jgi:hypothetical protein
MQTQTISEEVKKILAAELPAALETNPEARRAIRNIFKNRFADKEQTQDRFDAVLEELRRDREENTRKWEAHERKWETWEKKWEEERKEQAAKWDAQERKWEAQERKWEAHERKWEAWEAKWDKNQETIQEVLSEIKQLKANDTDLYHKYEGGVGALGARWGLQSEAAFRDGLKGILEDSFGVRVERYLDFDPDGVVFSGPDQIELDLIIHNGELIVCEIKSSASQSDIDTFWKKKNFYEQKHGRKADRTLIISPMVDPWAKRFADKFGIEVFGYVNELNL